MTENKTGTPETGRKRKKAAGERTNVTAAENPQTGNSGVPAPGKKRKGAGNAAGKETQNVKHSSEQTAKKSTGQNTKQNTKQIIKPDTEQDTNQKPGPGQKTSRKRKTATTKQPVQTDLSTDRREKKNSLPDGPAEARKADGNRKKERTGEEQTQKNTKTGTGGKNGQNTKTGSGGKTGKKSDKAKRLKQEISPEPSGTVSTRSSRPLLKTAEGGGNLKILFLGGLEQIGMNITALEYGDSIVVVDCGMAFPDDSMPGIDLVIPDVSYLTDNISKVKAFFITHGHEDHIGALPYILKQLNVPVYSTRLTIALISNKLREARLLDSCDLRVVQFGDTVTEGDFSVEFIKTNHSIQDAAALAISCRAGVVLHTGDFKVDYTPVFGDAIDLQRFAEYGRSGVLALLADSTNAMREGFTMSEKTVGHTFDTIFAEHSGKRIIVATFSSNVDRVQQVVTTAEKYGRKVVIEGRSMVNVIGTAVELGYIRVQDGTLIDISQLKDYPDEKTVLVTTGSQGESMAALSRMAGGQHKKVSIGPNDVVVMSSNPIPGNEKAVAKVINDLAQKHAEIVTHDTHVSGHACQEELKLIYSLLHPKYAIPVHGEYRHREAQRQLAMAVGMPGENVLLAHTGDVVELGMEKCQVTGHIQAGNIMVDGLGVGDVGNIVLRDRQSLSMDGIIIVTVALEKFSGHLLAGPDLISRGFVYVRENEDLLEEARRVVQDAVDDCMLRHVKDWGRLKNVIKDSLSGFIWKRMKREPVIIPVIMEI